jgi:hypothetical protein
MPDHELKSVVAAADDAIKSSDEAKGPGARFLLFAVSSLPVARVMRMKVPRIAGD